MCPQLLYMCPELIYESPELIYERPEPRYVSGATIFVSGATYYTGISGYLALSILLHQVLQVEVHVVFAQNVIAQGVFVVYSNLESALHKLLVQEGECLIEDDVFPASLQSSHSSAAGYSTARKAKPGLFKKGLTLSLYDVFCLSLPNCSHT